jgi:holo-[acyl-carrier protein] synthase
VIYGIGTDIVQVDRIHALVGRHGRRFAQRVLGPEELVEFDRRFEKPGHGFAYGVRYLAKRFAAKEAFSKALGTGLRHPMTLLSLQILNDARGKPVAVARWQLHEHLVQQQLTAHVSLTDEIASVVAFVVLEHRPSSARAVNTSLHS